MKEEYQKGLKEGYSQGFLVGKNLSEKQITKYRKENTELKNKVVDITRKLELHFNFDQERIFKEMKELKEENLRLNKRINLSKI